MPSKNWKDAVKRIRAASPTSPSKQQVQLASIAEIAFSSRIPALVAAARLRCELREVLDLHTQSWAPSDAQLNLLDRLFSEMGKKRPTVSSIEEYKAWLQVIRFKQRAKFLQTLKLEAGDIVLRAHGDAPWEVSSIGDDGAVFFKGGRCRAWPDQLTVVCRADDSSPEAIEWRRRAKDNAAVQSSSPSWSVAKNASLVQFRIDGLATIEEVNEFRQVVDAADDEKPIQEFLESFPQLVALILRGYPRFVIPRPQLGKDFVPDFLSADVDSSGIRWIGIELETPQCDVALSSKNQFSQHPRDGIAQVEEWREWLTKNLGQAIQSKEDYGLGLHGIRPDLDGIVVAGRRHRLSPQAAALRHQLWEKRRIYLHTYDGLLERMERALQFSGPPGLNEWLFQPKDGRMDLDPFDEMETPVGVRAHIS